MPQSDAEHAVRSVDKAMQGCSCHVILVCLMSGVACGALTALGEAAIAALLEMHLVSAAGLMKNDCQSPLRGASLLVPEQTLLW